MSTALSFPLPDLTPAQRRQQVAALLARGVVRRARLLRRSEPPTARVDTNSSATPTENLVADRKFSL